jgi:hypothetical protein
VLSSLSRRHRIALFALIVAGVAAAALVFFKKKQSGSNRPYDAIPQGAFLAATIDVAELRRSPLYPVLLGSDAPGGKLQTPLLDRRAIGVAKLGDACGFDPMSRVDALALGVPEEGDKGEIGVAAKINVTHDELAKCTQNLAADHGGKAETKDVGGFSVIEDANAEGSSKPRLAYGNGGLLLVGRGGWFDAMLATANGDKPSVRQAPGHAEMRASLMKPDGWGAPTVIVTALLPDALRKRIKDEMGVELENTGGKTPEGSQIMAGVLGVTSVGVALRAGASGGTIDAAVELACENDDGCAAVEKLLTKKRFEWGKELSLRMVGLGPLLDSIDIKRDGKRIRVTAGSSAENLASTFDRILRFKARSHAREEAPPTFAPKRDETIPAPRSSR